MPTIRHDPYVLAVLTTLPGSAGLPPVIRQDCPCCGATELDDQEHVAAEIVGHGVVLLVACDGYRVLDPNFFGFPDPDWQPSGE